MLVLKYLLTCGGIAMFVIAAGILAYDLYLEVRRKQALASLEPGSGVSGDCARASGATSESASGRARPSAGPRRESIDVPPGSPATAASALAH